MLDKNKKYPEGHFIGVGMAVGIAIFSGTGVVLSTSTGNPGLIGIGPAIGVAFGLAIGKSMEDKYRERGLIRALTKREKEARKKAKVFGLIALLVGMVAFLAILFLI